MRRANLLKDSLINVFQNFHPQRESIKTYEEINGKPIETQKLIEPVVNNNQERSDENKEAPHPNTNLVDVRPPSQETKPEQKPEEAKPVDVKPAEGKPEEAKPVDVKPPSQEKSKGHHGGWKHHGGDNKDGENKHHGGWKHHGGDKDGGNKHHGGWKHHGGDKDGGNKHHGGWKHHGGDHKHGEHHFAGHKGSHQDSPHKHGEHRPLFDGDNHDVLWFHEFGNPYKLVSKTANQYTYKFCIPLLLLPTDKANFYFFSVLKFEPKEKTNYQIKFDEGTSSKQGSSNKRGFAKFIFHAKDKDLNGWNSADLNDNALSGTIVSDRELTGMGIAFAALVFKRNLDYSNTYCTNDQNVVVHPQPNPQPNPQPVVDTLPFTRMLSTFLQLTAGLLVLSIITLIIVIAVLLVQRANKARSQRVAAQSTQPSQPQAPQPLVNPTPYILVYPSASQMQTFSVPQQFMPVNNNNNNNANVAQLYPQYMPFVPVNNQQF